MPVKGKRRTAGKLAALKLHIALSSFLIYNLPQ